MTNRREFLAGAAAAAVAAPPAPRWVPAGGRKMVGIQAGAVSFVDEGVDPVLDNLQKLGQVNTLFLATFTYGRGIAGRQVPGQPLPDHGLQEYDLTFHGGNYTAMHPEYYKDVPIPPSALRAPDHGDFDLLAAVMPSARRRGMKVVCWFEDVFRADLPGIELMQEKDLHGRNASTLCFNNPNVRNFWLALVEEYTRSYDIDGLMWGSERQGALGNAIGAKHGGRSSDPGRVTCFCRFCEDKARQRGISARRAREGYGALEQFVRETRGGRKPIDGAFVAFWRLLLRYPEILAWETLWTDSLRETYAAMHAKAKSFRPDVGVGWHIWHNNSFSPFYRAEQDIRELSRYSDFLKMVMYHNCGGERLASYIESVGGTVFVDLPRDESLGFEYRVMQYANERRLRDIPDTGLSADYVYREARRAVEGAAGTDTLIWPGIDIDIPTEAGHSKSTPEGTKAAVAAGLRAGAHGVLLSRKYSEMKLANLAGAGEAVREFEASGQSVSA